MQSMRFCLARSQLNSGVGPPLEPISCSYVFDVRPPSTQAITCLAIAAILHAPSCYR
jgi:hypothetical protein